MKKAIGYVRISDKDQSNFSIPGQQDLIRSYCGKNDIEVMAMFTDDGESAKNFDRPDWKVLEQFIKSNHNGVDMLMVAKFDRFSRNVAEALQMIQLLEQRYHIRVLSAMEPIHLHPDSPFYFQFRSQILLGADVELRIIRDRTRFGMQQAAKSGRYISKAPIGYINSRDAGNKPIILVDPQKEALIRSIYDRFLAGDTIETIRKSLRAGRVVIRGNSTIQRILQNPVYMGYVVKNSYYDEPEQLIKGLHQGIINEETWWRVHAIFNQKPAQRSSLSNDFPLRGVLKDSHGCNLTAAFSKGKKIYVGYYKCNRHKGNLNANRIHKQFDDMLIEMSLPANHVAYLQEKIVENITEMLKDRNSALEEKQQQLVAVEKKINNLEEKYFSDDVDKETYIKWKMRYHTERSLMQSQLADLREPVASTWQRYRENINKLATLQYNYSISSVEDKQSFVRLVFDNQLYYQDDIYRTPYLMDVFHTRAATLAEKKLLIFERQIEETPNLVTCAPSGSIIEPLHRLLNFFSRIKTA